MVYKFHDRDQRFANMTYPKDNNVCIDKIDLIIKFKDKDVYLYSCEKKMLVYEGEKNTRRGVELC